MRAGNDTTTSRYAEIVLAEIDTLPTLPTVAARLMQLGSNDDADIREIINLISADPALTGKVLSLCRRADLGLRNKITTVERAVVLLGLEAVRSLALSVHVFDWTERVASDASPTATPMDRVGFWKHSLAVAITAELLARENRSLNITPEEAFVAGLVHDIGKLVLDHLLPQAYAQVITLAEQKLADIATFERSYLGVDHHTAGKRLAEKWELPESLHDVIWLHAQRFDALPDVPHRSLIALIRTADTLCREIHLGWSGNHDLTPTLDDLCIPLDIPAERARSIIPRVHEALAERSQHLGLSDEPCASILLDSISTANRRLARMNSELDRRSRAAHDQSNVLDTLASFHARLRPDLRGVDCVTEVARSAHHLLGPGRYLTVYRTISRRQPWVLLEVANDGEPGPPRYITPHTDDDALTTSNLQGLDGSIRFLGWLENHVPNITNTAGLRVVPLVWTEHAAGVLVHDRDDNARKLGRRLNETIQAVWANAVAAAAERDATTGLGEELAQANLELVSAQSKLAEAKALTHLGELTAGAAHELNNPLTVIRGRSQSLARALRETEHAREAHAIADAAATLSDLVHRLHLIGRPPKPEFSQVSLVDLVGRVVQDARDTTSAGNSAVVPIKITACEMLPPARLDRELMREALLAVVLNAIEAAREGPIEVRVQTDPLEDRLLVCVTDDGPGFSEHARRHALDPFFSDKPAGRQTGLGLATANSLVRLHNGEISISSRNDGSQGAAVCISIPSWRWHQDEADTHAA